MAYQNAAPWHKLGKRMANADVDTALDAAGLRYDVVTDSLYLKDGTLVLGRRATLRVDPDGTRYQLGTVGDAYHVVQNSDASAILRPMIDAGCTVECAGALGAGERVWMLVKMAGQTISPVDGDDCRGYFLLHWSHDGSSGIIGLGTLIRVVCQNTLGLALGQNRKRWFTILHRANAADRIAEATRLMAQLTEAMKRTGDTFAKLARQDMGAKELRAYIERVIPAEPIDDKGTISSVLAKRRDTIVELARYGKGAELANQAVPAGSVSLWAAYNAVTEYFDHVRPAESGSANGSYRANESAIFGINADVKADALTEAQKLLAA